MKKNISKNLKLTLCIATAIILVITNFSIVIAGSFREVKGNVELDKPNFIETSAHIRIDSSNAQTLSLKLESDGFDVLSRTITETSLELIVNPFELAMLQEQGFKPVVLAKGRPFNEIQAERTPNFLPPPPGYLDLSQIYNQMTAAATAYPSICQMVDITTKYGVSPTYEDRHLFAVKISDNVTQDEDEPTFLMVSCHHAREIVTPVIALYAIDQFTTEYGSDPDITTLVDEYEIWIAPVWNPDGYEYVFNVNNMWRKNRFPPDGVDLNRNYPFGWYSSCSGSTDPYSETYKGSSPASEAETQTMIAFSNDRYFAKVLDYHSYGREVLWGYDCSSHPFASFFQSEAIILSTAAGYSGSNRPPSAEGEHYQWQIAMNGSYANLMETHTSFQPSYASAQAEAALVWPGTLWMLERPISLSGHVKDSVTGEPVTATITLNGITFPNGEEFISEPSFGRYHMFLPPGSYSVKFVGSYYYTQTHQITVTTNSAEVLEVQLVRYNDPPNTPEITGLDEGTVGVEYECNIITTDREEDDLYYYIDWGDGTNSSWIGTYPSGVEATILHTYTSPNQYEIRGKAKDVYGDESPWSDSLPVIINENMAPENPTIDGPTSGNAGTDYNYLFLSTDPEVHDLYYYIDWDDGEIEDWFGPFPSGTEINANHTWTTKGDYIIKAKARDAYGAESDWGTLEINIPRNKAMNMQFLQNHPNLFLILRYILGL